MNNCSDYQKAYNYVKNYQKNGFSQGCCCTPRVGPTPIFDTFRKKEFYKRR